MNLYLIILLSLVSINTYSQTFDTTVLNSKIKPLFREWKNEQISKGKYLSEENCNWDYIDTHPETKTVYSIPKNFSYTWGDLNEDGLDDVLYFFNPTHCDGGGATDFTQIKLLFISNPNGDYTIDDKFIGDVETTIKTQGYGGWLEVITIRNDTVFYKYRDWAKNDISEPTITQYMNASYPYKAVKKVIKEEKIYELNEVDTKPIFEGGNQILMQYISDNLRYPSLARENELEGRVIIKFYVDINGSIAEPKIFKDGVGGGCGDEALRLVKNMPKWQPALKEDKPVNTYIYLPLDFKLNK
jgi:TonB family protein